MQPSATPPPVLTARRAPKRARKVPKKTVEQKGAENLLVLLAFAGGLLLARFLGPAAGLAFAMLCGALLIVLYVTRWSRRKVEARRGPQGNLPPDAKTR